MNIRTTLKPLAMFALFALPVLPSCSTTPTGQSPPDSPLVLNTTIEGRQFYDLQPLKNGELVSWQPKDTGVLAAELFETGPKWCHGKGVEWHSRSAANDPPGAYRWEGTYNQGKAEGQSTVTYIKTMTRRSLTYREGRIISQSDPRPLSRSERDDLAAEVKIHRDSIFSGLGKDLDWEEIAADMGLTD